MNTVIGTIAAVLLLIMSLSVIVNKAIAGWELTAGDGVMVVLGLGGVVTSAALAWTVLFDTAVAS